MLTVSNVDINPKDKVVSFTMDEFKKLGKIPKGKSDFSSNSLAPIPRITFFRDKRGARVILAALVGP